MANIAVSLISFIALFSLLNMIVGYCGEVVGVEGLSIESLFGYLFYPGKIYIYVYINIYINVYVNITIYILSCFFILSPVALVIYIYTITL